MISQGDPEVHAIVAAAIGIDGGEIVPDGVLASGTLADLVDMTRTTLTGRGLPADPELVAHAVESATSVAAGIVIPIGDVVGVITRMRAVGLGIGVTTSDDRQPTLATLSHLGLSRTVDVVVAGDDGFAPKPAPDPLLEAARTLGVSPSASLYVGDSEVDLEAGRAAGMAGVVVVGGGRAGFRADAVIASIEEIEVLGRT